MNAAAAQDPGPGISRELAADRSDRVSEVQYRLRFELDAESDAITGEIALRFTLPELAARQPDLALDFAGEARLSDVLVNSQQPSAPLRQVDGHLLLSGDALASGSNSFEARITAPVASTGTAVTRYVDDAHGQVYLYTLLVPAEAHRLFPCFDQPDLRARFELELLVPDDWTAVSNAPESNDPDIESFPDPPRERSDGRLCFAFAPTAPLPTYLFAFAAGPFRVIRDGHGGGFGDDRQRRMRLFCRPSRVEHLQRDVLFDAHTEALAWLDRYFAIPYPFEKLDFVLLPGFPYGGMEHAGAIFYRENALSFERPPTVREQVSRSTLIYHEVAHQWFGNLVTMRWFDDLWLKEGFATLLSYMLLEELEPERRAWLRFLQRVKPDAYRVDATEGTTPIYQELANLADAKSNYGAIVYDKAPAVLRELSDRLGADEFRAGVRLFAERHAFGAATWRDLVAALQDAGGLRGARWSDRWILGRGMPRVRAAWETSDGELGELAIVQESAGDEERTWPIRVDVQLFGDDGPGRSARVASDTARVPVPSLVGAPAPQAVLLNAQDVAYGQFLLDEVSARWFLEHAAGLENPLHRATAISALEQGVREAEIDPARYGSTLLDVLEREEDAETHGWLLDRLEPVLLRWTAGEERGALRERAAEILFAQLEAGRTGIALDAFRHLGRSVATPAALEFVRAVLDGERALPEPVELASRDRFRAAAALLAAGRTDAVDREQERSADDDDVAREVFVAGAAAADPEVKARYFEIYLQPDEPPERWIQDSLETFHWPGQEDLTLPYLARALERAEWVKEHRRIFFMPAWLDAFVSGHTSAEALGIVERFLVERDDLAPDVRRKLLQAIDPLRRTIRIRSRWH